MRVLAVVVLLVVPTVYAQVLTHPRDMDLPQTGFSRPDPTNYELALENGLVAYVAEADQVPLVTLSAFVHAGTVSDDRQGAAEAVREALMSGPAGHEDFAATLTRMTADFSVDMHDDWTEISLNVPVEDAQQALSLFAALLLDPAIGGAAIERAAGSVEAKDSDLGGESGAALYEGSMTTAVDHFYEILFQNHPYGDEPTSSDFSELEVADARRFHAEQFVPGNMILAVAGDIDTDVVHTQIARLFGDRSTAEVPEHKRMPDVAQRPATQHYVPANKLQSWLVIGHDLPEISVEDQAAFDVMTYIIGAYHLNTRMMRETRYKYGYTNDASAFVEERWNGPGTYTFRSYSRPGVIQNIYNNMMTQIIRTRREEVSDHEIFVAKGALTDGLFPVEYLDGYALTRSFAIERLRYGDHDRSASYLDRVRAVTKKDVLAAARKYLRPENMQVVLVGEEPIDID